MQRKQEVGTTGQAGAMVHGISKALVMFDSENLKATSKDRETYHQRLKGC